MNLKVYVNYSDQLNSALFSLNRQGLQFGYDIIKLYLERTLEG